MIFSQFTYVTMNTRQQDTVNLLEASDEMSIKASSGALNVSQMTIHHNLEDQYYLYKKHGAAVFVNSPDRKKIGFTPKKSGS